MYMLSRQFEPAALNGWIGHRIRQAARAMATAYSRWHCRRRSLRYLASVDDRILDDIGIRRTEILAAVYHGRRGPDA